MPQAVVPRSPPQILSRLSRRRTRRSWSLHSKNEQKPDVDPGCNQKNPTVFPPTCIDHVNGRRKQLLLQATVVLEVLHMVFWIMMADDGTTLI